VQTNLKRLDLYRSSIDGLYGKGTADALSSYNNQNLNNADLKKAANVLKLLDAVLAHKFDPDPDATATIKPTEPPKTEPKPLPTIKPKSPPDETRKVASGTGFYVSAKGHIVTNHHVIDGCQEIKVHSKGKVFDVVKLASDVQNDLALLQIEISPSHVFALSQDSPYPLQNIIVAGFPFGHRYSSSLKFTQGIVSSLTGVGNNYSEIQIDAALQPGNSGGPIMDEAGNIVGVAVAKLALKQIVEDYGVIPENTNFGVKASAVRNLMEGNQVPTKSPSTVKPSRADLSRMATAGTVYLTCWMTTAQINQMRKKKVLFSELE
jgi:S1-C subfamily serine protease